MRHAQAFLGVTLLVVLPIVSRAFGHGFFSWTMYSGSGEYRLDIRVRDANDTWRSVAPTGLAASSSDATADVLIGADHFRRGPVLSVLRSHLDELAQHACRQRHGVEAEVSLLERVEDGSPVETTTAHVWCK